MKVAIIAFNNLNKSPYVNIYADFCKSNNMEYEIVYSNRENIQEKASGLLRPLSWDAAKSKLWNFLKFRKAVIRYLKNEKPDFVIVLTTMPAVLLSDYLCRHYKGRYLVDIRDYTYENVLPYFILEKCALSNSAMNVISSPGFKKFLPKEEFFLCQNINELYAEGRGGVFEPHSKKVITIGYVGTIAYKQQCMKLIHLVEKDECFRFYFYGDEGEDTQISDYLSKHPCDRIKAFGRYQPTEKVRIMKEIDILFNAYGYGRKLLDYALSNKLYDSFYMRIPLLTSPHTAMSNEAGAFSYDIDFDVETSLDNLFEWYYKIDPVAFENYSSEYLKQVFQAQEVFYENLKRTLMK